MDDLARPSDQPRAVTTASIPIQVRERTIAKARTLIEALPFMREHRGAVLVILARGAVLGRPHLTRSFAEDLALLQHAGVRPLVVLTAGSSTRDIVREGARPRRGVGHPARGRRKLLLG